MEFRTGDIVINPAMPQWGRGEVLAVSEGKVMVRFQNRIRKMAASFLALAETGECPDPAARKNAAPVKNSSLSEAASQASPASGLIAQAAAILNSASGNMRPADTIPPQEKRALTQAERTTDLATDARRKEQEDRRRREDAAILRFWRDTEVFIIPEVPRSSRPPVTRARRWEAVSAALTPTDARTPELPWEHPLPTGFSAAWHIVYLGVLPRQRLSDIILEKTGSPAEFPEEPYSGEGCLAAVVLDAAGMPLEGSWVSASLVPGLARCLAGKSLDGLPLDMLKMQSDFDRRAEAKEEPFRWPWMLDEIERLFDIIRLEDEEARIVVRSVYFRPDPKGRRIDDVQNDLLNSFYLTDLDRLLSLARLGFDGVFARYLHGGTPAKRRDVLSSSEEGRAALDEALSLDSVPRGRWPFPLNQQLLPAQLGAVNAILKGELTAVNGPPGTGKTRLLCEVSAELVVQRALRIARCRQPYEVFSAASGDFFPIREGIMQGTCMVAASSNNAAVENITRFLPAEAAVCRTDFPEASYFPEVAAAVNAAFSTAGEERREAGPTWGLMAAVLGSAWNCEQFARALFWGFQDQEKGISLPGMKQVLDEYRDYEAKQCARAEWMKTRTEFLECARMEEERRKALTRRSAGKHDEAPSPESRSMLSRFLELMAQSQVLKSSAREEDTAMNELAERLETLESLVAQAQDELTARKKAEEARQSRLRIPGRAFRDDPDWQLKSLWNDTEHSRLRSRLFLLALRLHEWTIKSCAREFLTDLSAVVRHLRGVPSDEAEPAELWNALFFMVPVVSSTLASFSRLFSGMGAASLDWLLLDEAGQAAPQSAAGALWRARRAAVIGDPQQIEPVVPQPPALLTTLRTRVEQGELSLELWSPDRQSAQTLADRASETGTWMDSAGRRVWTGFPLRAHHRCAEPMFSVANRIAYDNQMVQARTDFPSVSSPLGPSHWLDVRGQVADTQLVPEELACLRRCLLSFQEQWPMVQDPRGPREASVFVISPFRKVAWHGRALLRAMRIPEDKLRCGTIHTFQGREADIVFLVLGSAPGQAGWGSRQWASRSPNILNVALTRARSMIYVIGNLHDWRRHPFFDLLSEELPVSSQVQRSSGNSDSMRLSPLLRPAGRPSLADGMAGGGADGEQA